jgi:hypothetical protein
MTLTPDSVELDSIGTLSIRLGSVTITRRLFKQEINALMKWLRRNPADGEMVDTLRDSVTLVKAQRAVIGGV